MGRLVRRGEGEHSNSGTERPTAGQHWHADAAAIGCRMRLTADDVTFRLACGCTVNWTCAFHSQRRAG
jgi:hypothetical protein